MGRPPRPAASTAPSPPALAIRARLRTNGTIVCWGNNEVGQTDVPSAFSGDSGSAPEEPDATPEEPEEEPDATPEQPVATPEQPVATPEEPEEEPEGTWPGPPQKLRLDLVEGPGLRIRWDAPADDGGAPGDGLRGGRSGDRR